VIISDKPLTEYLPLHRPTSNSDELPIKSVAQYDMDGINYLGLLKVDFLGLVTLTIMSKACEYIAQRHGIQLTLSTIPIDDPEVYQFISEGHTVGLFQLEGNGMTRYLVQMKPQKLETLSPWLPFSAQAPWTSSPITSSACTMRCPWNTGIRCLSGHSRKLMASPFTRSRSCLLPWT